MDDSSLDLSIIFTLFDKAEIIGKSESDVKNIELGNLLNIRLISKNFFKKEIRNSWNSV
jgi:hypothetical protein